MPMHDWTRVEPTIFHHFHQRWAAAIADALNAGRLPTGLSALIEKHSGGLVPDVLAVERRTRRRSKQRPGGTLTVPRTRMQVETSGAVQVRLANRVAIRHRLGEVVCIIEIVSPGNKASKLALREFVEKTTGFLQAGVNVLLIDPFPPGPRDPYSLHKVIWDEYEDVPFDLPADERLLLAAYRAGDALAELSPVAYLEPLAVGAVLPDMPAWIDRDTFVDVPLESSYNEAWVNSPADFRYLVENGRVPDEEPDE